MKCKHLIFEYVNQNLKWISFNESTKNDLKTLFEEVGDVSKVRIKFDKAGRSEGEATVVFNSRSDALRAIEKFDGVELWISFQFKLKNIYIFILF